jgi:serine/threonine protein kinase/Tfp pilus assembly protein PilF
MTIYEFSKTEDGDLFLVGEYVEGLPLNRVIGKNLKVETALDFAVQIASALSAAHEAGITHRDIKPENIIVRQDGYVKVLDFGLAKLAGDGGLTSNEGSEEPTKAHHLTMPGAVMGTAAYMSPEQARGVKVDSRTDIWSLGVVVYEMISGTKPFSGETTTDIIVSVLQNEPPPMITEGYQLPAELEWIVLKALAKDVDARYQTAKELRADLEKIKKRIEFDETLNRSSGANFRDDNRSEEEMMHETVEQDSGSTSLDVATPTDGGQKKTDEPKKFWSSRSVVGAVVHAQSYFVGTAIIALILLVVVSATAYFFIAARGNNRKIDSIAVLPLENLSGSSDLDYLSDGLSDSLINRFSELPQLKVISRNSSFKFRGSNIDTADVASQLGVNAIVTGSVSRIEDDLLIRFEVVDAENRHITGGQYRRKQGDILKTQTEFAETAAEKLELKLTDSQSKRFTENVTEDSEAYRYYLNGLVELNGPNGTSGKALELFQHAVTLDPNFASAYAEISWVYVGRANSNYDPNEVLPMAKAAADRAISLDPNQAKAYVIRAMLKEYEFDWRGAEVEYLKAIELNPNLDFARNNYAFFLSVMDRQEEALAELEQQRLRDPINRRLALLQRGIILVQARRFDEALQAYKDVQAMEASEGVPDFALGYAYAGKGQFAEAAGYYKKTVDKFGSEEKYSQPLVYLAATYAKIPEKRNEAIAIIKRIEATGGFASPALLAAVYSALDDNDKAMELLEQAYTKRDLLLRFIGTGYEYDGLRKDPRFADLLRRTGLKQ